MASRFKSMEHYFRDGGGEFMIVGCNEVSTEIPNEIAVIRQHASAVLCGVQGGDILVAVNGRPAAELTLDQIRRMFMQDGTEHLLSVKREQKVLHLKMRLKRIV